VLLNTAAAAAVVRGATSTPTADDALPAAPSSAPVLSVAELSCIQDSPSLAAILLDGASCSHLDDEQWVKQHMAMLLAVALDTCTPTTGTWDTPVVVSCEEQETTCTKQLRDESLAPVVGTTAHLVLEGSSFANW